MKPARLLAEDSMIKRFLTLALLAIGATFIHAQPSLPSSFQAKTIHRPEAADIFVRWGGKGPVVVLIHGYAENSDSWAPLATELMKDHTVVVPDLRGIGKSSKPESGYDEKTQAKDIRAVVTGLGYDKTSVVAHDIGKTVAYAYAAMYPDKVERLVVLDAPIPGIEPWNEILLDPRESHSKARCLESVHPVLPTAQPCRDTLQRTRTPPFSQCHVQQPRSCHIPVRSRRRECPWPASSRHTQIQALMTSQFHEGPAPQRCDLS